MSVWRKIVNFVCRKKTVYSVEIQTELNVANESTQTDTKTMVDCSIQTEILNNKYSDVIIGDVYEIYKDKYIAFYSDFKPKRTHFNKNLFFTLCQTFDFDSFETLQTMLDKENLRKKVVNVYFLNEIQKKKCEKHNFYLFS